MADRYPLHRDEARRIGFDFTKLIARYLSEYSLVVTVSAATVRIIDADGDDQAADILASASATVASPKAYVVSKVTTEPVGDYTIECEATLSNGEKVILKDANGDLPILELIDAP